MRKIYFLFVSFFFIIYVAYSQIASVDIDCGAGGKFWTVTTPTGSILEWQISGTTITFIDTLFVTSPVVGIAYCNLLNAGTIPTTIYGCETTTVSWYNGSAWVTITPSQDYFNPGGCGRFLYFMISGSKQVDRYNGTAFTNILTLQNAQFTIADLAVDSGGNIWSMVSMVSVGDTLAKIDSAGNIVKTYSISPPIDEDNAYGCFLMDSTLYIGIGNANTTYPNTVIPIRIYADTAIEGSPIPFVNGNFVDMASCNNLLALGIQSYIDENKISLSPNPATNELRIKNAELRIGTIEIYNVFGEKVYSEQQPTLSKPETVINVSAFPTGVYFVRIADENGSWVGKFVKE
jgi:hypothetical protein